MWFLIWMMGGGRVHSKYSTCLKLRKSNKKNPQSICCHWMLINLTNDIKCIKRNLTFNDHTLIQQKPNFFNMGNIRPSTKVLYQYPGSPCSDGLSEGFTESLVARFDPWAQHQTNPNPSGGASGGGWGCLDLCLDYCSQGPSLSLNDNPLERLDRRCWKNY